MRRKIYEGEINFVTLTVVGWINIYTRRIYCEFIMESLRHCHDNKGLILYSYVLMTNHLHMVVSSENMLSAILRDFKSFTCKRIVALVRENPKESRKRWILREFRTSGAKNRANKKYQLWQNGNYPTIIYSDSVKAQKIEYIHQNPVKAGFVDEPEYYRYSSANPANPLHDILVH